MNNQEFDMLAEKNLYIQSTYEQLQVISQDDKKRMEYEAREKAIRDYNYLMSSAEKRGIQQGIQQGIRKGQLQNMVFLVKNGVLTFDTAIQNIIEEDKELFMEMFNE